MRIVEEVSFFGAAAGVPDHAGGTAGQSDGAMAAVLESTEVEQHQQVSGVQAVRCGVEAAVDGDRTVIKPLSQACEVGAVVDQATGLQVVEDGGSLVRHMVRLPQAALKVQVVWSTAPPEARGEAPASGQPTRRFPGSRQVPDRPCAAEAPPT